MIKVKRYFIDFQWNIELDAKIGEWVGQYLCLPMTLSVGRIDIRLTPYKTSKLTSWKDSIWKKRLVLQGNQIDL